jgi:peptidoglycan hydrolase-like protein with peptidoglycan-binding domain
MVRLRVICVMLAGVISFISVPLAAATCPNITQDLVRHSQHDEVVVLKRFLNDAGFLRSGLSTKYFGIETKTALMKFQQSRGINSSGITDLATREAFNACNDDPKTTKSLTNGKVDRSLIKSTSQQPAISTPLPVRDAYTLRKIPTYARPVPNPGSACSWNFSIIPSTSSVLAYAAQTVRIGQSCSDSSQIRTCRNGVLSGSYQYASCIAIQSGSAGSGGSASPGTPVQATSGDSSGAGGATATISTASCSFNNQIVLHDVAVIAYITPSVSFGQTCFAASQSRTCRNGLLSGSYAYPSCVVLDQVLPNVCTPLPTETRTSTACPLNQSGVISEQRASSCAAGSTVPVFSNWTEISNTCTPVAVPPSTCALAGVTLNLGSSTTFFADSLISVQDYNSGLSCKGTSSAQRTCGAGNTFSGSNIHAKAVCVDPSGTYTTSATGIEPILNPTTLPITVLTSPAQLTGLSLWLNAHDSVSLTGWTAAGSSSTQQWLNRKASANFARNGLPVASPYFSATDNAFAYVAFDGLNDYYQYEQAPLPASFSVFVMADTFEGNPSSGGVLFSYGGKNALELSTDVAGSLVNTANKNVYEMSYNSATSALRTGVNNTYQQVTRAFSVSAGDDIMQIARNEYLGKYGNVKMREVVVYDRVLTNTEKLQISSYLNSRWNTGAVATSKPCSLDGKIIKHGEQASFYKNRFAEYIDVLAGNTCANNSDVRSCINGVLDTSAGKSVYTKSNCTNVTFPTNLRDTKFRFFPSYTFSGQPDVLATESGMHRSSVIGEAESLGLYDTVSRNSKIYYAISSGVAVENWLYLRLPEEFYFKNIVKREYEKGSKVIALDFETTYAHYDPAINIWDPASCSATPACVQDKQNRVNYYMTILQWAKEAAPDAKIGYYWSNISYTAASSLNPTALNAEIYQNITTYAPLIQAQDILFPTMYVAYGPNDPAPITEAMFAATTPKLLAELRKIAPTTPIIPFVIHEYSREHSVDTGGLMVAWWKNMLINFKTNGYDGVIHWAGANYAVGQSGSLPWEPAALWWTQAKEFVSTLP